VDNKDTQALDSRREFLRKAALLAAGGTLGGALAASIQRALAIEPLAGSSYLDAEHIVIIMQENRSFDHVFGMLAGVRGFNDPRAVTLPDGKPVWFQTGADGETYGPFRLDLMNSRATWMGELPHGRRDQGEARNNGKHDRWLQAKPIENKDYAGFPLTLGHYCREDVPFYYGLADAFTVCDQAFCSVIGPTTPNRLHLWTGTVRAKKSQESRAHVQNEDTDFGAEVSWKTFPERLEELGVSWKTYQNELAVPSGLEGDSDAWLSNFGDNPLECFTQYGVYFAEPHRRHLAATEKAIVAELAVLASAPRPLSPDQAKHQNESVAELIKVRANLAVWSAENFNKLPARQQNLHRRAFVTNSAHPDYRELATLSYKDGATEREMVVPKGDVMHQFREDVRSGQLPAVSWIVPPERFSDHPSNPWYGALYVSETLDILTKDPEVWRKTVFILCYDENDGYFDHIPPFVPPRADRTDTGKVSPGIDTSSEHVREGAGEKGRDGPIGLGFRVPLVVASPWSRGGYVCSEVFDHTSILRFLEKHVGAKTGREIRETNISDWRRTVCGDLTSVFRPFDGRPPSLPESLRRDPFLAGINQAQFEPVPKGPAKVAAADLATPANYLPRQEPGIRPACSLPYELAVGGALDPDTAVFRIGFSAGNKRFGSRAAGAPFRVYSPKAMRPAVGGEPTEVGRTWDYAVVAGGALEDSWSLDDFAGRAYFLRVHGPNGFFREFQGSKSDPRLTISMDDGPALLSLTNLDGQNGVTFVIDDLSYGGGRKSVVLAAAGRPDSTVGIQIPLSQSRGWYDFTVSSGSFPGFQQRYAGRVETGGDGFTDPLMA
jgi:phospholipase C